MIVPAPPAPTARIDFETYSEAGFVWDSRAGKWTRPKGSTKYGIFAVGSAAYAEHWSTEVLTLSYKLPGGEVQRWKPGRPSPQDLIQWAQSGGLISAHNVMFERLIWEHILVARYGFPPVRPEQWRCTMATAHVNSFPGALDDLGAALALPVQKDKEGKRLIKKFSVPQRVTKKRFKTRIMPEEDPEDFALFEQYCDIDVMSEEAASNALCPMSPEELQFWQIDQEINYRGIHIDVTAVKNMIAIMEQHLEKYTAKCVALCGIEPSRNAELIRWLATQGVYTNSLDEEHLEALLEDEGALPEIVRDVLKIKALCASASVKKLYAVDRMVCKDNRLRNLYVHHGARTGRPTGQDFQPTNLKKAGPKVIWGTDGKPYSAELKFSPWNGEPAELGRRQPWSPEAVEHAIELFSHRNAELVEQVFGDPLLCIGGSIRGVCTASPGCDFISSDYSAIEAVVSACAAGEQWRIETFRRKEDIYLASISKKTGRSLQWYAEYKRETGQHHPDRQNGKIGELAGGFGGWIDAWRGFGATGTDEEIRADVLDWRNASPAIVEMWGGQGRGFPGSRRYRAERYGIEGAAINAVQYPGQVFSYRQATFYMRQDALIMRLPSGRELIYNQPRLLPSDRREGELQLFYWTHNSNPKYGQMGWTMMSTYGPRLFENFVQAASHCIQRHGIVNLWKAGYRTVLHTYDEMVAEVPKDFGSVEEFESIMGQMPWWASDWPIRADGGWRGLRYRKV